MNKLEDDVILKFVPDTLVKVRKEFGLDKPDVLKASLDELEQWVSKQKHFVKKDFSRESLERILVICKGSVEKAKLKLDKSCTVKGLLPLYFETLDVRADMAPYDNLVTLALLPQLTDKYERVFIIRNMNYCGKDDFFSNFRYYVKVLEYLKKNDYSLGVVIIIDYMNLNLKNLLPRLNLVDLRHITSIVTECYGLRLRKLYVLSSSKLIDTFIKILKQVMPGKIRNRIELYKDYKKLHKELPVSILPEEYEGPEKCIDDLHEDLLKALTDEKFVDYLKEMKTAITNENLRDSNIFNESYLGAPGSLHNMIVD